MKPMQRFTIWLDAKRHRALKQISRRTNRSVSDLVRQGLAELLEELKKRK